MCAWDGVFCSGGGREGREGSLVRLGSVTVVIEAMFSGRNQTAHVLLAFSPFHCGCIAFFRTSIQPIDRFAEGRSARRILAEAGQRRRNDKSNTECVSMECTR